MQLQGDREVLSIDDPNSFEKTSIELQDIDLYRMVGFGTSARLVGGFEVAPSGRLSGWYRLVSPELIIERSLPKCRSRTTRGYYSRCRNTARPGSLLCGRHIPTGSAWKT